MLDKKRIKTQTITGTTPPVSRARFVDSFQRGEYNVLILQNILVMY